jgi:hypothetical protein
MTMPVVNPGEVWMIDFGMAAKVRPALLPTGTPADDELDIAPHQKIPKMVRIAGLEPAQVTPLPPQSSASANSAICAQDWE